MWSTRYYCFILWCICLVLVRATNTAVCMSQLLSQTNCCHCVQATNITTNKPYPSCKSRRCCQNSHGACSVSFQNNGLSRWGGMGAWFRIPSWFIVNNNYHHQRVLTISSHPNHSTEPAWPSPQRQAPSKLHTLMPPWWIAIYHE